MSAHCTRRAARASLLAARAVGAWLKENRPNGGNKKQITPGVVCPSGLPHPNVQTKWRHLSRADEPAIRAYVREMTSQQAYYLMAAAEIVVEMEECEQIVHTPSGEGQARQLARITDGRGAGNESILDHERIRDVWQRVLKRKEDEGCRITAKWRSVWGAARPPSPGTVRCENR